MRQSNSLLSSSEDIARYFREASLPSQQETLGQIVVELLRAGKNVNRKGICTKLVRRLELASTTEEEKHFQQLIGLLLGR